MSSARSAASARMTTRSGSTSRKPPETKRYSSTPSLRTMTSPVRSGVSRGMWWGSTPRSPAAPGASTKSASWETTRPSAVTSSTFSFAISCPCPASPSSHGRRARSGVDEIIKDVQGLLDKGRSFNLYVVHGGTNFGFWAGANSGGQGDYLPDVTSYDYDAPINEQGRATVKYRALREVLGRYRGSSGALPEIPADIPAAAIPPITLRPFASLWQNLPRPVASVQPRPMEDYGQDFGMIAYQTTLFGHKSGNLVVTDVHDYATVFVDGRYIGKLDRREGVDTIALPKTDNPKPVLTILVEGMGRINFGQAMIDRKGITDRVTLNGMTLMNWQVYSLPLKDEYVQRLPQGKVDERPGIFFRGTFDLSEPADTFLDLSEYQKGLVWVNGHNLGRYWNLGPQRRLYCPASWLRRGQNQILVLDLHQLQPAAVTGFAELE